MAMPIKNFSAVNPSVMARNDAKQFVPFSPALLKWLRSNTDAEARPAMDAIGLGLHLTVAQGATPILLPASLGGMTCLLRTVDGTVIEGQLLIYVSDNDLARLRAPMADGTEELDADDVRIVYAMGPALYERFAERMRVHFSAGRLEPVFRRGVTLRRGDQGITAVESYSDVNHVLQLNSWLEGNNAILWRFAPNVPRIEAELLDLRGGQSGQRGDSVMIYAEVIYRPPNQQEAHWYRVNPGLVLSRMRSAGESDSDYAVLTDGFTAGGVASGATSVSSRGDLCAVVGGSRGLVVLQPRSVVPPSLFSFITSDEVRVFASALADGRDLVVRSALPTMRPEALMELWARNKAYDQIFGQIPSFDFPLTRYSEYVAKEPPRNQDFYDDLSSAVSYGPSGQNMALSHSSLPIPGEESLRVFILHEDPLTRPGHHEWTTRSRQLRRIYPLRYYFRLGADAETSYEFAVEQDRIDCSRQEYVFHLNWTRDSLGNLYFQPGQETNPQVRPANSHARLDANGLPLRDARGDIIPAIVSSSGRVIVPHRSDYRNLKAAEVETRRGVGRNIDLGSLSPYRPLTLIGSEAMTRLGEVRARVYDRLRIVEQLIATPPSRREQAIDGSAALSPFLKVVVRSFLVTLPAHDGTPTTDPLGFLNYVFTRPVSHPLKLAVVERFRDDLALARGAAVPPPPDEEVAKDLIRASSSWRGPEHNEVFSITIASNHQVGLALDLQPTNAPPGRRNPLFIACLHDVAQGAFAAGILREALLELDAGNYLLGSFNLDKLLYQIARVPQPGGVVYRLLTRASVEVGDLIDADGLRRPDLRDVPSVNAARDFSTLFANVNNGVPWPPARPPTYGELYLGCLYKASHVHFTFVPGAAIPWVCRLRCI
jgi:hypothetical protein